MKRIIVLTVLTILPLGCAKGDPCAEMQEAIDENAGLICGSSDDCASIPCVCADGSTINATSCGNGQCGGLDACEDACGEIDAECSASGGSGGGKCCVYACESGGIEASGSTSSATDDQSCRDAANEFCGDSFSLSCSAVLDEQCSDSSECVE